MMPTIVFTGGGTAGHVAPNMALISELSQKSWEIIYIGSAQGIEKEMIKPLKIPFYGISSGKLRRYLSFENLKDIFKICEKIKSEEYYVNMAKAWLLSVCYVKYREETYKFLEKTKLDAWTVNKSIQKIRESLRVTKEEKEQVLILKRK